MENNKINENYYTEYKSKLIKFKETINQSKQYEDIFQSFESINNTNIYIMIELFKNNDKWTNINLDRIYNDEELNREYTKTNLPKIVNKDDNEIKNIFNLIIQWIYFLYNELIKNLYEESGPNFCNINKIRYLLNETSVIVIQLFKSNAFNSEYIFTILNLFLFLIDTNYDFSIYSDKLYKLKNYLLLKEILFIFQEAFIIIFNNVENNNEDIKKNNLNTFQKLFYFLEKFQNSKEINYHHNIEILIKLLVNSIHYMLKKINIKLLLKYDTQFKNKLINFYSHFLKFNYKKSKIYNKFLDSLKNSFINLYDFDNNKEKITNDLFIQSFYMKLIKKIFFFEENTTIKSASIPQFNSFFFNGFDSQISLNLQNIKFLDKSSLFFSFNLNPINNREIYPLFQIEKFYDKKNSYDLEFYVYLKQTEKNDLEKYDLFIFKDGNEIKVDTNKKILSNTNYYFNITFNVDKVYIIFYNGKGEIIQFELEKIKKIFDSNAYNLIFGFNKKELSAFSGYIGPIIMIKNPSNTKEIKLNEFISFILKLQKDYQYFLFLEPNSSYSLEYMNYFHINNLIYKIKSKLEKINSFECFLYLTPDLIKYFNEENGEKNNLPDIGIICPNQQNYGINNLNVTLVKYEQGIINFIMDNGLNYICLLYEYIYQFMQNYSENDNNAFIEDKDFIFKLITSIFKKTLYMIKLFYSEIKIQNFNKSLKQIYMNLFSCVKIISQKYIIIDSLINNFCDIIINHFSLSSDLKNNKKGSLNKIEFNEKEINNELFKIYMSFLNGWIDFLLTPELYDFNDTQTLINLFNNLALWFKFEGKKESSKIINQHFCFKLLNFTPYLNQYFEQIEFNIEENKISSKENKQLQHNIENLIEKKEVLNCFLKAFKNFFENNPSKADNLLNLKNVFKYITENLEDNYQASLAYFNLIKDLIGNNSDLYFSEEKDEVQIKNLLNYANIYSQNLDFENDEQKDINKKNIFNKLISIIIKIIFTKKRINKSPKIVEDFKNIIKNTEITIDLIITITEEIKNIIEYSIESNINIMTKKNDKKGQNYSSQDLKYLSNFYSEIFDLILFLLEYPIKNSQKIKDKNIYEGKIYELLKIIEIIIKSNFENNKVRDIKDKNEIKENNKDPFTIDTIYCLISFLKFFNNILFKRLYSDKYIDCFINICELCHKSCLINSNILIELENCQKTILEIILDICIHYMIKSSRQFDLDPLPSEEINNVRNDSIIKEQELIFDYLKYLFDNIDRKNKDIKKKYSIFFNNDYLRFLSENFINETKKNSKKEIDYSEYLKEFQNYKTIYNFLYNAEKFNYNFSTFFLIKLGGYNKILINQNVKFNSTIPKMKEILKFNELFKLIVEIMHIIYDEQEKLYAINKDYFFKSKKANSTSFNYYMEVKRRIENNLKNKKTVEYPNIDNYIINEIFGTDYDNVFFTIYSGLCKEKEKTFSFHFSQKKHKLSDDKLNLKNIEMEKGKQYKRSRFDMASNDLFEDLSEEIENPIQTPKIVLKEKLKEMEIKPLSLDSKSYENKIEEKQSQEEEEEEDFELFLKEIPSSEQGLSNKIDNNLLTELEKNNKKSSIQSGPDERNSQKKYSVKLETEEETINKKLKGKLSIPEILPSRLQERKKSVYSSKNLLQHLKYFDKKERPLSFNETSSVENKSFTNENNSNSIPYINYFDEPDEYYLKNPKKELMMNTFSLYFFKTFFYNNNFKQLKEYYLQHFEGVQSSTKKLDFPSKMKNYNNGLEPYLFFKPFTSFFETKIFPITHKYFYDFLIKNKISPEPIILYKKNLNKFYLEEQFDKKCELIKSDHNYFGHIIGSKKYNFVIFEQSKYEFYEENNSIYSKPRLEKGDLDDLFTLSFINKKPQIKKNNKVPDKKNLLYKNKKTKEKKIVIILFNEIEEILERRFLLMWQAVEIYLKNGKSYFFNFLTRENCKSFLEIFKKNNITKDKIHEKNYFRSQKYITSKWVEERLSTYEYLLFVNKYSSRTFNDSNQYPIFPWIITNDSLKGESEIYRNFKYPMAAQTKENQDTAINRFQDDEENNQKFPSHFGTHYSTSSYVYYYLMREEPFTTLLVKLQGYKQENPDRMFYSLEELLYILSNGHDNREMIPDLFFKIEHFINLNCVDFGIKNSKLRVDDFIAFAKKNIIINNHKEVYKYVKFVIENRNLLNKKEVSDNINDWIDIIFGIGQLPPDKNRKKSINIFYKETYEQQINLHKKLEKKLKEGLSPKEIINKISNKLELIISFGQTPYQLFTDKHPKYGKVTTISTEEEDFESVLFNEVWNKELKLSIETEPSVFVINDSLGKLFLIDEEKNIEIIDCTLFDQKGNEKYQFKKYGTLKLSNILFFDTIETKVDKYYIFKQKYCFSSFDEKNEFNFNYLNMPKESENRLKLFSSKELGKFTFSFGNASNTKEKENNSNTINYSDFNDNDYISYYNIYLNQLKYEDITKESKKLKKLSKEEEYFRFITCGHIDNTFKIYNLPKNNSSFKKDSYKPISFVCEDFVSSCCAISHNKFLIGLKNGKLIQWSIEERENANNKSKNIVVKYNKQIQAHNNKINVIEINHRLGIIITAGSDNYVFIRKIYDLELLIPIKFKPKYIITMVKVSPMNFLYIICFNKENKKSRIFGYTLNGLNFAKSSYNYYDTLDFTKSGNIVTWVHKKEIQILFGDNLNKMNTNEKDKEKENDSIQFNINQKKLYGATWFKFSYFFRKNEQIPNVKIITYTNTEKNKGKVINTLDVSKINYFD